jgi:hypothetical protein
VNRMVFGVIAGLLFGAVDILPMLGMEFPNRRAALLGAFASRFAIGLLIPLVQLPLPAWARGAFVGLVVSLPDAFVTGHYGPILASGIVGGLVIGAVFGWLERRATRRPAGRDSAAT